jgi:hypothetical protein
MTLTGFIEALKSLPVDGSTKVRVDTETHCFGVHSVVVMECVPSGSSLPDDSEPESWDESEEGDWFLREFTPGMARHKDGVIEVRILTDY